MLILVGILIMVGLLGISVTTHYRSQVVLQIMLRDEAPADQVQDLTSKVQTSGYAAEVVFTTKEQAARMMEEELGEEFVGFLGYNPLPASIDLKLNPDFNQEEQLDSLVSQLEKHPATYEVVYQKDLLEQMNRNLSKWSIALVLIGALLMVIALVLIVNTIQLAIFSQRFLIKSMQLVGATRWFIQKPFLRRGLWYGLVSGVFALFVIFVSEKKRQTSSKYCWRIMDCFTSLLGCWVLDWCYHGWQQPMQSTATCAPKQQNFIDRRVF